MRLTYKIFLMCMTTFLMGCFFISTNHWVRWLSLMPFLLFGYITASWENLLEGKNETKTR